MERPSTHCCLGRPTHLLGSHGCGHLLSNTHRGAPQHRLPLGMSQRPFGGPQGPPSSHRFYERGTQPLPPPVMRCPLPGRPRGYQLLMSLHRWFSSFHRCWGCSNRLPGGHGARHLLLNSRMGRFFHRSTYEIVRQQGIHISCIWLVIYINTLPADFG